jgi:hypothetical protein
MKKSTKGKFGGAEPEIPEAIMQKLQQRYQAPADPELICPEPEQVVAYALNELEAREHEKLQAHLLGCRDCLELFLDVQLAQAEAEIPADEQLYEMPLDAPQKGWWHLAFGRKVRETLQALVKPRKLIPALAAVSLVVLVVILGRETKPPGLTPPYLAMERHSAPTTVPSAAPPQELAEAKPSQALPGQRLRADTQKSEREAPSSRKLAAAGRFLPGSQSIQVELEARQALDDGPRLSYKVDRDAFALLLRHDGSGKVRLLFSGNLAGGQTYHYPEQDQRLKVDSDTARATLYLIASEKPLVDPDKKVEELEQQGIQHIHSLFPGSTIRSLAIKLP